MTNRFHDYDILLESEDASSLLEASRGASWRHAVGWMCGAEFTDERITFDLK